jgi:hypothetical protein
MKYALREVDFDDGVSLGHDEQDGQKTEISYDRFQRTLLAVEERRLKKVKTKELAESKTIEAMAKSLRPHIIAHVKQKIADPAYAIESLLRLPANFLDLVDILYSPTVTYSRIASIVKLNHVHDRNLLHMVNRSDFQAQIGKSVGQKIKDTQVAISLLGIEGAKALLPVMMIKQTIKLRNEHFPLLGFKLWKLILSTGLSCHHILQKKGYHDPVEGLLGGILYAIGSISLYHQFIASFEDVKKQFLMKFRQDGKKMQHDFLLRVEPEPAILFELMQQLSRAQSLQLVQHLDLKRQRPKGLSMALEQALSVCSINQCSPLAQAIRQGNAYGQLEQLRHAKLIGRENIAPFLAEINMGKDEMTYLLKHNLTRLEIRDFVD